MLNADGVEVVGPKPAMRGGLGHVEMDVPHRDAKFVEHLLGGDGPKQPRNQEEEE